MADRRLASYLRLIVGALAAAALVGPSGENARGGEARASDVRVVRTGATLQDAIESWQPQPGGTERRTIRIPEGVRIDLGNLELPLELRGRLTLESTRGELRRGAELFLDDPAQAVAIKIVGTDVVVRNLRLRGPSSSTDDEQPSLWAIQAATGREITISGNEISEWPGVAVSVYGDDEGVTCRPASDPPAVRVLRNYIHHNQKNPVGYGVQVKYGGVALIEGNTFDWNRHAIAGNGRSGSGYYARWNYVLSGGSRYSGFAGTTYYNQHFDMHGTGEGGYGGIAGQYVSIWGNTFHGAQRYGGVGGIGRKTRPAYFLRGRPCRVNSFRGNVLWHDGFSAAVRMHITALRGVAATANDYDSDTSFDIGVGDFDGDGRDDLFQATGAAWYYSSGAFAEWRLLQSDRPEPIDVLRFGDFDRDGRTDVFTTANGRWLFSSAGRTSWRGLAGSSFRVGSLGLGDFDGDRRTDVFRASGSRWYYSRGGRGRWLPLAESRYGLEDVRFGNFDGDRRTDVLGSVGGRWSVSYDARSPWQPLPGLAGAGAPGAVAELTLADFDGNGRTDVAWSRTGDDRLVQWLVVPDGIRAPRVLRSFTRVSTQDSRSLLRNHWIGGFDGEPGADPARYEVRAGFGGIVYEGPAIMKASGGSGSYTHRGIGMR